LLLLVLILTPNCCEFQQFLVKKFYLLNGEPVRIATAVLQSNELILWTIEKTGKNIIVYWFLLCHRKNIYLHIAATHFY